MYNKTNEIYEKIKKQFKNLSKFVEGNIRKTNNGYYFSELKLALFNDIDLFTPDKACEQIERNIITIEEFQYIGDKYEDVDLKMSSELFFALANFYTPDKTIFVVYKKNPDVDGDEGLTESHRRFYNLGDAIRYAEVLITRHFRGNKSKKMPFPNLDHKLTTSAYDDGAYPNSVHILPQQLK
jgi:hypothetical protein